MKLAILKDRHSGESRVAASPDSVKKLKGLGLDVAVEAGAGLDGDIEAEGLELLDAVGRRRDAGFAAMAILEDGEFHRAGINGSGRRPGRP